MKKLLTAALSILGFILIAAPTAVEYHPFSVNGISLGTAHLVNGIIAVRLSDFAKLGGGTLTLEEAGLTLTPGGAGPGLSTLKISSAVADAFHKHFKIDPAYKETPAAKKIVIKGESHAAWARQRDGVISSRVFQSGGDNWVPVEDIANAFGGVWKPVNLAPSQPIHLRGGTRGVLVGL